MLIPTVAVVFVLVNFFILLVKAEWSRRSSGNKPPPWLLYLEPGLGHSLKLLKTPLELLSPLRSPCRLRIPMMNPYIIPDHKNIRLVFKQSKVTSPGPAQTFIAARLFGMPQEAAETFIKDTTGYSSKPLPGTDHIEPRNRICYRDHELLHSLFQGPNLARLNSTFYTAILRKLDRLPITERWLELPDLFDFLTTHVSPAAIEAFVGPSLTEVIDPTFVRDFWEFDSWVPSIAKNAPRFWASSGFRLRDKLLESIVTWREHLYCLGHAATNECPQPMLEKFKLLETDGWDMRAIAASDLGLIWASNSNTISALFWLVFEICRSPELLAITREECQVAMLPETNTHNGPTFDTKLLCSQPYLQACFAEVLRQRNHIFITRYVDRASLRLEEHFVPAKSNVIIPSSIPHMDDASWNTGIDNEHPLQGFWPQRFLQCQGFLTGPSKSGHRSEPTYPCKSPETSGAPSPFGIEEKRPTSTSTETPQEHLRDWCELKSDGRSPSHPQRPPNLIFTTKGLEGIYIPFGGGAQMCPGRNFARTEVLLSTALLLTWFDIELCDSVMDVGAKKGCFGTGVSKPDRKVRFRIKKKLAYKNAEKECCPIR